MWLCEVILALEISTGPLKCPQIDVYSAGQSREDLGWEKTKKIYLCLRQELKFPREEKGMMQADENDAKAQALWVTLS